MLPMRCWMTITLGLVLCVSHVHADTQVREEQVLLPIQINSRIEKVETLIVRPVKGDNFPIALIVNGSAAASPSAEHADWLAHIAHDFAHRGWLAASIVWPGYGRSTGVFMDDGGTCAHPSVARFLDSHGDELGAALATLRKRPDVDPSLALGVGISIGGASMLDLAAQPNRPLAAVINISGGVYHYTKVGAADANCSLFQQDLVRNFTHFGQNNPTPTLWIYAANDPFFSPNLVEQMITGYRSGGGKAELVMLPPFGKDGHTLYKQKANTLLKPHIEGFLTRNLFPAMDDSGLMPLISKLAPADRLGAEAYVQSVTEKAMAMSEESRSIFWHYGARSVESARQQALDNCRRATGGSCQLVAQNMELIEGWQDLVSPSGTQQSVNVLTPQADRK